jgi:hypothetical protein
MNSGMNGRMIEVLRLLALSVTASAAEREERSKTVEAITAKMMMNCRPVALLNDFRKGNANLKLPPIYFAV